MKILFTNFLSIFFCCPLLSQPVSLDTTFGNGGIVITDIGDGDDYAYSMALQSDGKILVAGTSDMSFTGNDFALVRYNKDGNLDSTFGSAGKITIGFVSVLDVCNSVTIQNDGKILMAGYTDNTLIDFALVRLNTNGTLDNSFGSLGKVITDFEDNEVGNSVLIQNDGRIVVGGYIRDDTIINKDFGLVCYDNNGSLDSTFGTNGKVITPIGNFDEVANSMAIQSDGKILLAGYSDNGINTDFALVRYDSDGNLYNNFGIGGKVITSIGDSTSFGCSIAIQADGKIVFAGYTGDLFVDNWRDFALVRYNIDGSLDASFGIGGKVTTNFLGGSDEYAYSVAIQNDGKILVGGNNTGNFALARYNSNGTLDSTFGSYGIVISTFGIGCVGYSTLALQSDGKIVMAGRSNYGSDYDFALARFIVSYPIGVPSFIEETNIVKISPNPFTHSTTIRITNKEQGMKNYELLIYNLLGQPVHRQQILNPQSEILNLNLSSGIYFYKVRSDRQQIANGKLVIN